MSAADGARVVDTGVLRGGDIRKVIFINRLCPEVWEFYFKSSYVFVAISIILDKRSG